MMKTKIFISSLMLVITSFAVLHAQPIHEVLKVVALKSDGISSDSDKLDNFGGSVAISGNFAIVGAKGEDRDASNGALKNDAGAAYIFKRQNGNSQWEFDQKIVTSDRDIGDSFGSVAISGSYAIVGAAGEDHDINGGSLMEDAGAAYIFERDGSGNWNEVKKIVAPIRADGDRFGTEVSISGNYVIVGAAWHGPREPSHGFGTGAAFIYERSPSGSNGIWNYTQTLQAYDKTAGDQFGAVSISGNYAIVGAFRESEDASAIPGTTLTQAGSAYIFKRNNSSAGTMGAWTTIPKKIVASDRDKFDHFGYSVAISGDYVIVGAYAEDEDENYGNTMIKAGSAYVFEYIGGSWIQVDKLVASDRTNDDEFGIGVAIAGDYAVVGAYREDHDLNNTNFKSDAGSAYVFKRVRSPFNNWHEVHKLISEDRQPGDSFGRYVAISECSALIGAFYESMWPTDDRAGASYFFECEESVCNIPKFNVSVKPTKLDDDIKLQISAAAMIKKVEISMTSHQINYNNELCKTKSGVIGSISSSTPNFGGLTLTNNNSRTVSWVTGLSSPLNGNVVITVSKPGILNLPCCDGNFNFCLLVKVTDIKGNVCEEEVCASVKLKSLTQFPGDTDIKPF